MNCWYWKTGKGRRDKELAEKKNVARLNGASDMEVDAITLGKFYMDQWTFVAEERTDEDDDERDISEENDGDDEEDEWVLVGVLQDHVEVHTAILVVFSDMGKEGHTRFDCTLLLVRFLAATSSSSPTRISTCAPRTTAPRSASATSGLILESDDVVKGNFNCQFVLCGRYFARPEKVFCRDGPFDQVNQMSRKILRQILR